MFQSRLESEASTVIKGSVNQVRSGLMRHSSVKVTLMYLVVVMLGFLLVAYIGHALIAYRLLPASSDVPFWAYSITLALVLLAGMLHISALRRFMSWIKPDDYLQAMLMTLLMAIVGCVSIYVLSAFPRLFHLQNMAELKQNIRPLVTTGLIFPLPFLLVWAHEAWEQIPPPVYNYWRYNPNLQLPPLDELDLRYPAIVTFVLDIRYGETNSYDLRAQIPQKLTVGESFQLAMEEHNMDEPGRAIEYRTRDGRYYEWYLYVRRSWFKPLLVLDPDKRAQENHLRDGDRIIARRVPI